jgi:hypothetical protein
MRELINKTAMNKTELDRIGLVNGGGTISGGWWKSSEWLRPGAGNHVKQNMLTRTVLKDLQARKKLKLLNVERIRRLINKTAMNRTKLD